MKSQRSRIDLTWTELGDTAHDGMPMVVSAEHRAMGEAQLERVEAR